MTAVEWLEWQLGTYINGNIDELNFEDFDLLENMIKDGDIIRFDDSKHEKKYDDLKERNGRFG